MQHLYFNPCGGGRLHAFDCIKGLPRDTCRKAKAEEEEKAKEEGKSLEDEIE